MAIFMGAVKTAIHLIIGYELLLAYFWRFLPLDVSVSRA